MGLVTDSPYCTVKCETCINMSQKASQLFELDKVALPDRLLQGKVQSEAACKEQQDSEGGNRRPSERMAEGLQLSALPQPPSNDSTLRKATSLEGTWVRRRRKSKSISSNRAAKIRSFAKSLGSKINVDRYLDASDKASCKVWPAVRNQVTMIVAERALELVRVRRLSYCCGIAYLTISHKV